MRQFAKSAISLGWALSLLGIKQAYGFVANNSEDQRDVLASVTQTAVGQLDDSMKRVHRYATNMESCVVDMAFAFPNPIRWANPQHWKGRSRSTANSPEPETPGDPAVNQDPDGGANWKSSGATGDNKPGTDCGCTH
jgi:hypothetical protein